MLSNKSRRTSIDISLLDVPVGKRSLLEMQIEQRPIRQNSKHPSILSPHNQFEDYFQFQSNKYVIDKTQRLNSNNSSIKQPSLMMEFQDIFNKSSSSSSSNFDDAKMTSLEQVLHDNNYHKKEDSQEYLAMILDFQKQDVKSKKSKKQIKHDSCEDIQSIDLHEGRLNKIPDGESLDQIESSKVKKDQKNMVISYLKTLFNVKQSIQSNDTSLILPQHEPSIQSQDIIQMDKLNIQKRYAIQYLRNPLTDPYNIYLKSGMDYEWIQKELFLYSDKYPLFQFRKIIVYFLFMISFLAQKYFLLVSRIVNSNLFVVLTSFSIIFNITVFIMENSENKQYNISNYINYQKVVLILFSIEVLLKFIGMGYYQFSSDSWNIIDILIIIASSIHIWDQTILSMDVTPIRIMRLLFILGLYFKRLKIMIVSLRKAVQFLKEVMAIVMIFTCFFALCALHLLYGLFRLRCFEEDTQEITEELCGFSHHCLSGQYCDYSEHNEAVPSNFDNFLYSYGQIIRIMIYNDWTEPVYLSMRFFHPSSLIMFMFVVFIGGIFCSNLIIAVLKTYYSQTMQEYESKQIDENSSQNSQINLQVLKCSSLWQQIKILQMDQMWVKEYRSNMSLSRGDIRLTTSGNARSIRTQKTVDVGPKIKKYLSARQARESNNQNQNNVLIYQENGLIIKDYILPNKKFIQDIQKLFDQYKQQIPQNVYQLLKYFPYLSWKKIVKYDDYQGSSINDIFNSRNKEIKKKNKRSRELDFIKRCNPKQLYLIKDSEIKRYIDVVKQKPNIKCQYILPIKEPRPRKYKDFSIASNSSNNKLYYQTQFSVQRSLESIQSSPQIYIPNTFYLNGQLYDYDDIAVLINRDIIQNYDEESICEDQYIEMRLKESKELAIVKHNNSSDDVIPSFDLMKKAIVFKSLNYPNKIIWIKGIRGMTKVSRNYIILLLRKKIVEQIFDFVVLIDIICVCLEGIFEESSLQTINNFLTIILYIELILKLYSLGLIKFTNKFMNIIDCILLHLCVIEIIIRQYEDTELKLYLDIMRASQAILFYRIIKYNRFAVQIAIIIEQSFNSFLNLIVLMVFVIIVFSLIGMALFKDKFPNDNEVSLSHQYNDFAQSFMQVFDRSTGDDWYGLVINGTTYSKSTQTMLYCIALVYILVYMTFGFVLAIILEAFSNYQVQKSEDIGFKLRNINSEFKDNFKVSVIDSVSSFQNRKQSESKRLYPRNSNDNFQNLKQYLKSFLITSEKLEYFINNECQYSLYIFSQENWLRRICYRIQINKMYNLLDDCIIILSIFLMAQNEYQIIKQDIHETTQIVINCVLFISYCNRIITFGIFSDNGSLSQDVWRTIDFIYTILFLIDLTGVNAEIIHLLLHLKYLRPMRLLGMIEQLKEIKQALYKSMPDLINIFFVQLMVWILFAIFGTIIYKNQFGYCEFPLNYNVNKEQCQEEEKEWIIHVHNFDNIFNAVSTLFVLCTGDTWALIFQSSYNSNLETFGPTPFHNKWITYFYYFWFILIGQQFFIGFFTGILFINFQNHRNQIVNQQFTEDQIMFQEISEIIINEHVQYSDPPNSQLRKIASILISNKYYKKCMKPIIIIESAILSAIYYQADLDYFRKLNISFYCVTSLTIIDTILKLAAYGFIRYWGYLWRKLEFLLTLQSIIDFILYDIFDWTDIYFQSNINQSYFAAIRIFFMMRNLRLLLLIQEFQGLSRLFRILYYTLPFLIKIMVLYLTIQSTYALLGVELYGQINKGELMDDQLNFENFPNALLTLFKCSTKNQWRFIMVDCTDRNPYCQYDSKYCGQDWYITIIYFYSYILIQGFIVLNLFVLALVEQFESKFYAYQLEFYHSQNSVLQTYIENIDRFRTIWSKYSVEYKGQKMSTRNLAHFLLELGPPLGSKIGDNIWDVAYDAFNFHLLADCQQCVTFNEFLYEIIKFQYKKQIFQTGPPETIHKIKQFDRNFKIRLFYKKEGKRDSNNSKRRSEISSRKVKRNFNVLQDYLFVLTAFRTWVAYQEQILQKARQNIYTEGSNNSIVQSMKESQGLSPRSDKQCTIQKRSIFLNDYSMQGVQDSVISPMNSTIKQQFLS